MNDPASLAIYQKPDGTFCRSDGSPCTAEGIPIAPVPDWSRHPVAMPGDHRYDGRGIDTGMPWDDARRPREDRSNGVARTPTRSVSSGRVYLGTTQAAGDTGSTQPLANGQLVNMQDEWEESTPRALYLYAGSNDSTVRGLLSAGVQVFPVAEIIIGANDMTMRALVDVPMGTIVRVPVMGTKVSAFARVRPLFADIGAGSVPAATQAFNQPGKGTDVVPTSVNNVYMAAMIAAFGANASDRYTKPTRRLQNVTSAGNSFLAPIADGATSVRVLADTTKITAAAFNIGIPGGATVPIPVASVAPFEIPQNAQSILLTGVAGSFFEIVYYLGF